MQVEWKSVFCALMISRASRDLLCPELLPILTIQTHCFRSRCESCVPCWSGASPFVSCRTRTAIVVSGHVRDLGESTKDSTRY